MRRSYSISRGRRLFGTILALASLIVLIGLAGAGLAREKGAKEKERPRDAVERTVDNSQPPDPQADPAAGIEQEALIAEATFAGAESDQAISAESVVAPAATVPVDGNLETDYNIGTASTIQYTRDQGGTFTGRISILEDDSTYYVGFMQALDAKSNAYCPDRGRSTDGCFQTFGNLVGSDYISFEWEIGGETIYVPVDIISADDSAPSGFATVPGRDGGSVDGISEDAAQMKSAMDYNLNVLGWRDFENSPNFAGQPSHPYIYPSIAEVGITKAGLAALLGGDGSGLATALVGATVVVHNSPAAPTAGPPVPFIECPPGEATGTAGGNVTITVIVTENGQPLNGAPVLAFIASGPGSIVSVGGVTGNEGLTGADGTADIVVTSGTAGTTEVRAVHDVDGDGTWDQGTDPETVPLCPVVWTAGAAENFDLSITKTVDKSEAVAGDTLLYTVTVTNTGEGRLTNLVITDPIPQGTTYVAGSASSGGIHDAVTNILTWSFPSLDSGQSVTVTFSVTINSDAPSEILNVAIARADQAGPKDARVTTRLSAQLGGRVTRPAAAVAAFPAERLPTTGGDWVFLLLVAFSLGGAGLSLSAPPIDLPRASSG